MLRAGNINDISMAEALIQAADPFRRLLADRGYHQTTCASSWLNGIEAVIPAAISRKIPIPYDTTAHSDRNRVVRMWCRLKDFWRAATRYHKLVRNFLSGVFIAATCAYWLN